MVSWRRITKKSSPFALKEYGNTGTAPYEKRVYLVYRITDVIPMDDS